MTVTPMPAAYLIPEAQKVLGGVSRSSVERAIRDGRLRAVKFGGRVLIPREAIEELLTPTGGERS